ncbi:DUF1254 domain-containing protein [Enterobacter mori]|uniref:DUF1254 domain-containing protein n=1 Tax=Enterobacter mori TaxID=539813 RepID=UPI002FD69A4C
MSVKKSIISLAVCGILACSSAVASKDHLIQSKNTANVHDEQLIKLISDMYEYAYPLVLMDVTMKQATNVADKTVEQRAPINQFAHFKKYPDVDDKDVVRFNFDTLYSMAWLDLNQEPMILSIPDMGDRYFLLPMLDMWTDVFAVPGTRTTGQEGGVYAIATSDWKGILPKNVKLITAPTDRIWIIGRIQTNGKNDFDNVSALQDKLSITPLSQWGDERGRISNNNIDLSIDMETAPLKTVENMSGVEFFNRFAELMKTTKPHANDYPMLSRMEKIGLIPGANLNVENIDKNIINLINITAKERLAAMKKIILDGQKFGRTINGWNYATDAIGAYGTSYQKRAVVALGGLGANLSEDAIYPNAFADSDGNPLNGKNDYVIHFEKDQLPPANAFWSITMYDNDGFQVKNQLNRFSLGDRDNLQFNDDGSLDIFISKNIPIVGKVSNWLPAPQSGYQLTMRIYSPKDEVLSGEWVPPVIKKTN